MSQDSHSATRETMKTDTQASPAGQHFRTKRPNVVYLLADQLRARSLPAYGERQIATPNIDRIAREGIRFSNAVATCPLCAPYRSMLVTGRQPLETGHVINNVRARHDEISIADAFNHAGYRTGWVGKWHLYSDEQREIVDFEYIPDGRDRLGFDYFRAYNYHTQFFDGPLCLDGGRHERWRGYETTGLLQYVDEFLDEATDKQEPFCLFVAPHMPHHGGAIPGGRLTQDASPNGRLAPDDCLRRVPAQPSLPVNVPEELLAEATDCYRDYLAMTVAVDDMLGAILQRLQRDDLLDGTIVVFGSDHGSLMGAHGLQPWQKRTPWEESVSVPLLVRLPRGRRAGSTCDALVAPEDLFPTLCGLCSIDPPRTVSGRNQAAVWLGRAGEAERQALFTYCIDDALLTETTGSEWKGVRTRRWSYWRCLDGSTALYDIRADPLQLRDLIASEDHRPVVARMAATLERFMREWNDEMKPATEYLNWFEGRRIARNTYGPLGDPFKEPDWSLL